MYANYCQTISTNILQWDKDNIKYFSTILSYNFKYKNSYIYMQITSNAKPFTLSIYTNLCPMLLPKLLSSIYV